MFRVTFVHAPATSSDDPFGPFMPFWAYVLASHLPKDWCATLLDARFENLETAEDADVFAFSGLSQDLHSLLNASQILRDRFPAARQILGGPITWSLEQEGKLELLAGFDHVCVLDGEEVFSSFLRSIPEKRRLPWRLSAGRFSLAKSTAVNYLQFGPVLHRYLGAVVEVGRGCPFLCEFCDVRVLPENNATTYRPANIVTTELEQLRQHGVRFIQLACDNFAGNLSVADALLDAIIGWRSTVGAQAVFYTWASLDVARKPRLLVKMRDAGIVILFVGIETANQHALRETAKVQNLGDGEAMLKTIVSHGFIVIPGLILGFDSDGDAVFQQTRNLLESTGVIAGDPQFLVALPGTPLFKRMASTGRLVQDEQDATVRRKVQTNVVYRQSPDFWISGYRALLRGLASTSSQRNRFRRLLDIAGVTSHTPPVSACDWLFWTIEAFRVARAAPRAIGHQWSRMRYFLRPDRFMTLAWIGVLLVLSRGWSRIHPLALPVWLAAWSTLGLHRATLVPGDFRLHGPADCDNLFPQHLLEDAHAEPHKNGVRVLQQARLTAAALRRIRGSPR